VPPTTATSSPSVALVHDYLTQRGGAERVVLSLSRAFPGAPLYTSLYDEEETFPAFADLDVRTLPLNRVAPLRRHHRAALPFLAPAFSSLRVDADVVVCSSSGWGHGARTGGRKVVYCHTPARWLYQPERYLRGRPGPMRVAARLPRPALVRWDRAAAASADRYLANSSEVAGRIAEIYGIEAEVLPPPASLEPDGPSRAVDAVDDGFVLCVSRLLPYKNVDAVVAAFARRREDQLVVVGSGPDAAALRRIATPNVTFLDQVGDDQLRWLYARCRLLVATAHEDYGLTPIEAARFGKPVVALAWGGYLDTVEPGLSGLLIRTTAPGEIAAAIADADAQAWDREGLVRHAERFSEESFAARIGEIVAEVGRGAR
jgi:glycosyltransferase involved in cell wall biosynthesis